MVKQGVNTLSLILIIQSPVIPPGPTRVLPLFAPEAGNWETIEKKYMYTYKYA